MIGVESVTGSLLGALLTLATLVAAVAYGALREEWAHRKWAHRATEGPPLKRAA
jgi:hypothetical protein